METLKPGRQRTTGVGTQPSTAWLLFFIFYDQGGAVLVSTHSPLTRLYIPVLPSSKRYEQVAGSLFLTDKGVEILATASPRLTHVDVSGCPGVTRWVGVWRLLAVGVVASGVVGLEEIPRNAEGLYDFFSAVCS